VDYQLGAIVMSCTKLRERSQPIGRGRASKAKQMEHREWYVCTDAFKASSGATVGAMACLPQGAGVTPC